ncbi:MAG: thymidine phosphorylase [bacterium]
MESILDIIIKKRDGESLSPDEIKKFIENLIKGEVSDYQLASLLMAIYLNGLDNNEIYYLTDAICKSGKEIDLTGLKVPVVDKHSTGGVGDKVSLIVAPLVAGCGIGVGLTAGRGLGHTGGTIDKLESIPSFKTELNERQMREAIEKVGCFIVSQSEDIAPADKILYAMRDVSGTIESLPLVVSSILGKKLAVKTDGIVFDIKYGVGAFCIERKRAEELGDSLSKVASLFERETVITYSEHNSPYGRAVGNSVEVIEAVKFLRNEDIRDDLREVCFRVGALMLIISGAFSNMDDANRAIEKCLTSGEGLERFRRMVEFQGGNGRVVDNLGVLKLAKQNYVKASFSGVVIGIDAKKIGELVRDIGGGRRLISDEPDRSVGIEFNVRVGSDVSKGDLIAIIYKDNMGDDIVKRLLDAITIKDFYD